MPDGRFLSKSIAHDVELNGVSLEADLLFERCVPHLDVEGRMPGHPIQVKAIAVPIRPQYTSELIESCLAELASVGLVRWYEVGGRRFLEFPGFDKNQRNLRKDREAPSTIPPAPAKPSRPSRAKVRNPLCENRPNSGPTPESSGVTPESSGPTPPEVKVSEVKVSNPPSSLRSDGPPREGMRKRASRLPDGWSPSPSHAGMAGELRVDVSAEADKFRDWAAGNGRTQLDWDATFRNWLRNAQRYGHGRAKPPPARPTTTDVNSHWNREGGTGTHG